MTRLAGQRADRGSATIWVMACGALLMVIGGAVVVRTQAVLARHRAESSADLAALAAAGRIGVAADGCRVAATIAKANGAALCRCWLQLAGDGRSGQVRVIVGLPVRLPIVGSRVVVATARAARRRPVAAAEKVTRELTRSGRWARFGMGAGPAHGSRSPPPARRSHGARSSCGGESDDGDQARYDSSG
jgi:secretion/DNA translocation related TadE-like protein